MSYLIKDGKITSASLYDALLDKSQVNNIHTMLYPLIKNDIKSLALYGILLFRTENFDLWKSVTSGLIKDEDEEEGIVEIFFELIELYNNAIAGEFYFDHVGDEAILFFINYYKLNNSDLKNLKIVKRISILYSLYLAGHTEIVKILAKKNLKMLTAPSDYLIRLVKHNKDDDNFWNLINYKSFNYITDKFNLIGPVSLTYFISDKYNKKNIYFRRYSCG